jgi:hypothetical protein
VIVIDLDIISVTFAPAETDSPLIVDSNTMLSPPVSLELFEPVAGRNSQFME